MKILFVGGTGVISSACSKAVLAQGHELTLLNRGVSDNPLPQGGRHLQADINQTDQVTALLKGKTFDCVVDWIAYTPADVQRDMALFQDKTSHYVFISSASVYAKPPALPVVESHPTGNPFWDYAHQKILCEAWLNEATQSNGFPVTIVRPSHTYDATKIPLRGGVTTLQRLLTGKPVIVHGDGTSFWTLTHHTDFARGFVPLLGHTDAADQTYHITGDEVLTWDQIYHTMAEAAGVAANIFHLSSETILKYDQEWGEGLLGDKAYNMVFDNSKIKALNPSFETQVPFAQGAQEILSWFQSDPKHQVIDTHLDTIMDRMINDHA
ncbi:MAG: SDR family oxidoreductase [Planctomycetes bacterium]|nr:SDR family oxidoreductase [Planctomycetota bacterium]